jgi:PAS domain S-box-containing protein
VSSPERIARDLKAFLALVSSLSGRLAGATGDAVDREVESGLRELLTFFGVEQCGILEFQRDRRKARLRHFACVEGVTPVPATLDYGAALPWSHARAMRGQRFVQTCIDDLPSDAVLDRAAAAALGLQTVVSLPVGIGGHVTHVLALVSSQPVRDWPDPILAWLQMIAETFLAVLTRRRVEEALAQSERTLAQAQHVAQVGSYVCDWSSETLDASAEAERIFGRALGTAAADLLDGVHPDDRSQVREVMERMFTAATPSVDFEYRIVRPDGDVRTVRSRSETIFAADGKPERTLATIQDISHLRAAEEESRRLGVELRHADRAAHLGALTASLSHELSQPLTGILANSQAGLKLLERPDADPAELRAILESIVRDDKRAAAVIANLRLLLRREEPERESVDVAEAIGEVLALFRGELDAKNVRLEAGLERGCDTQGVKTQIQQVIVNLLSNAVHALAERAASDRSLVVSLARVDGDLAEIRVRDNGMGIPPERLPRIFEPFYSTKTDGLGMGLAISRSIVEAHGGEIAVQPEDAGGTAFRILLPVGPAREVRPQPELPSRGSAGRAGASDSDVTVCVVDDDPAIREGISRLLGAAGMRVVAFESGAAALADPETAAAQCLVLDVQMPGMPGTELQSELGRRGIPADVIFLTARSDAVTGVNAMKHGALEYLCKPVDEGALLDAVRMGIGRYAERVRLAREREGVEQLLERLTARERDVLHEVIAGRLNKQIADRLSISEATVKQHRGQVMEKLRARSVPDLVRLCQIAGFPTGA